MQHEIVETYSADGVRLCVVFDWQADRFRHAISLSEMDGSHVPLMESIEGSPADHWPPSPPLQSLHCEALPGGSLVALLVGMAGRGHWSASVGPRAKEHRLVFDLACRAGGVAGRIGTSYRLASGVRVESAASDFIRLQGAGRTVEVAASHEQATRCELVIGENAELKIEPADRSAALATRRWLYAIALNG